MFVDISNSQNAPYFLGDTSLSAWSDVISMSAKLMFPHNREHFSLNLMLLFASLVFELYTRPKTIRIGRCHIGRREYVCMFCSCVFSAGYSI